VEGQAVPY
jgi:hypothetical protein